MKKPRQTKHGDYETIVIFPVLSNYKMHVILTKDIAKSAKSMLGITQDFSHCEAAHRFGNNGHSHLFYMRKNTVSAIVHEAWHAVRAMFRYNGMKLDDETVAYHLGYLVEEICAFRENLRVSGVWRS